MGLLSHKQFETFSLQTYAATRFGDAYRSREKGMSALVNFWA